MVAFGRPFFWGVRGVFLSLIAERLRLLPAKSGEGRSVNVREDMEKFIVADSTALRISDRGKQGPAVVLLHGYLESLDVWSDFTALLSPHFRVVAIDIPGHGISQVKGEVHTMEFVADVLKGVLDKLGIERCFVVGHSMGGYVAEAFAAAYPERLLGLVLFHSTPNPDTEEKKEGRRREIELIRAGKKETIAALFAPKGFAEVNRKRLREQIAQQEELICMCEDEVIVALWGGLIRRRYQNEMLRKLAVPQLFIFGRMDGFIPVEAAGAIIAVQPQAEVAWLENSGHMGFIEEPERSAEILTAFFNRVVSRNGGTE